MQTDEYPTSRTQEEDSFAKRRRAFTIVEYSYDEVTAEVPVVEKQAIPYLGTVNHLRTYPFAFEEESMQKDIGVEGLVNSELRKMCK